MTRLGRLLLGVLLIVHIAALLAAYLAPYPYAEQHRDYPYAPPTRIHLRGWRPVVYGGTDQREVYPIRLFPGQRRLFGVDHPEVVFLLGTDAYGRDIFSRLLYGARISLFTGLMAAAVSLGIGLGLGTLAGFYGGAVDQALMRGSELFLALPWLYLLLAVRAFLPLHMSAAGTVALLVGTIGCLGWVRPARLVRGVILSGRERTFVAAARSFGASDPYLIRRHLLPMTWGVMATQATILIPRYVMAEVALSFVGLGVGEPVPTWGNMLAEAREYSSVVAHLWLLSPGLVLIPVLLLYLGIGDIILDEVKS